jgi:3-oxoacyl-[acyl-carrier protein] reductase
VISKPGGFSSAFVTGGSRGIGKAVVDELLKVGIEVTAPTRAELDLSDLKSVEAFTVANMGFIPDLVVLNAGENSPSVISEITMDAWQKTIDVNLSSNFLLIRDFGSKMMKRGSGRIVVVSSCYSFRSRVGRAAYSASKAGLNALVQSAALEFAANDVLVNAVCPGFVLTDLTKKNNDATGIKLLETQIPLGKLADPIEVAKLVLFLGLESNTYITGQTVVIDGGFTCQ